MRSHFISEEKFIVRENKSRRGKKEAAAEQQGRSSENKDFSLKFELCCRHERGKSRRRAAHRRRLFGENHSLSFLLETFASSYLCVNQFFVWRWLPVSFNVRLRCAGRRAGTQPFAAGNHTRGIYTELHARRGARSTVYQTFSTFFFLTCKHVACKYENE